ncbi:PREDICTED: mucin-17-like [Branchiostoma belcheri]|uniref:Mucin-17-like n=1 Tax=Branchiostoma belcheri TaxID=7741 RepID=A0A6P5A3H2_BRABE|nr:PREDICTED: mucin-17-like [Branchiostoma belcheri]
MDFRLVSVLLAIMVISHAQATTTTTTAPATTNTTDINTAPDVSSTTTTAPVTTDATTAPVTTDATTAPVTTDATTVPVTTDNTTAPVTTDNTTVTALVTTTDATTAPDISTTHITTTPETTTTNITTAPETTTDITITTPDISIDITTTPDISTDITTTPEAETTDTISPVTFNTTVKPSSTTPTPVTSTAASVSTIVPVTPTEGKPVVPAKPIPTEKPDVAEISSEVIIIVAVGSSIQFDEPFDEDLKDSTSQAYKKPNIKPGAKRQVVADVTVVNYEVDYNYTELQKAGGIDNVTRETGILQAVENGALTVGNKSALVGSSVQYTSQADLDQVAVEKVLEQINKVPGGLCSVVKCEVGYNKNCSNSLDPTCVSRCEYDKNFCKNHGQCVHTSGQDVFCNCDHDPTGFYMGGRCEFYASQPLVIGVGAGVGGFLFVIIIALSICLCCRRQKKGGDFERQQMSDHPYWTPDEKSPMTKQTDDIPDEMPLYSMVNKRQTYSEDSSGSEKNNLTRASRLSNQERDGYVMPAREQPANNSLGYYEHLQTFAGGRDNRAFDWKPTTASTIPIGSTVGYTAGTATTVAPVPTTDGSTTTTIAATTANSTHSTISTTASTPALTTITTASTTPSTTTTAATTTPLTTTTAPTTPPLTTSAATTTPLTTTTAATTTPLTTTTAATTTPSAATTTTGSSSASTASTTKSTPATSPTTTTPLATTTAATTTPLTTTTAATTTPLTTTTAVTTTPLTTTTAATTTPLTTTTAATTTPLTTTTAATTTPLTTTTAATTMPLTTTTTASTTPSAATTTTGSSSASTASTTKSTPATSPTTTDSTTKTTSTTTRTTPAASVASTNTPTQKPTTPKITIPPKDPEKPSKIVAFELSLQADFEETLNDSDSTEYQDLERNCVNALTTLHAEQTGFQGVRILGFRSGSIIVSYIVIFENSNLESNKDITNEAEDLIRNGNLTTIGNYTVNQNSFREIDLSVKDILEVVGEDDLCHGGCTGGKCNLRDSYGVLLTECVCEDDYCKNGGQCHYEDGPKCSCDHDPDGFYMGERCDFYASQPLVIGVGAGVGGFLLLIIIILSTCLCCCRRQKEELDFERTLPDKAHWTLYDTMAVTNQTENTPDVMPLNNVTNKRHVSSDGSSGPDTNNSLPRTSRLSNQDRDGVKYQVSSYATPTWERPRATNQSFLHGNT